MTTGALALALVPVASVPARASAGQDAGACTGVAEDQVVGLDSTVYNQKNFVYHTLESSSVGKTNDPAADRQYYLDGVVEDEETGETVSGSNVRNAWASSGVIRKKGGSSSVTIAELDTGVDIDHEDLAGNIDTENMGTVTEQEDGSYKVQPGSCEDIYGHGTAVAGVLAASASNGKGIAGVSYNARLLPVNVCYLDDSGSCATDTEHLLAGFSYLEGLIKSGELTNLRVINISLGSEASRTGEQDYALEQAIKTFRDEYNVLTVCAGGNGDSDGDPITDRVYPSDFDETLSVSWLDADGRANASADYNEYKDISAPGTGVYTTLDATKALSNKKHESYGTMSGSSMSAPIVSGIAALLWAKYPDLTIDEVRNSLLNSARTIPDAPDELGSAGAVDAGAALVYAREHYAPASKVHISQADVLTYDFSDADDWYLPYTGKALKPRFWLFMSGELLVQGFDYTISYKDNTESGTATVTFTGIGSYQGTKTVHFDIVDDIADCTISSIPAQVYKGSAVVPELDVFDSNGIELEEGSDYIVSATDNKAVGKATVQVRGIHGYRGTLTASFWIVEKSTASSTKTVTVNSATVTNKTLADVVKSNTTTVTLGSKVKGISAGTFKDFPKITKLVVKTKKLTKDSVKGALEGSKVKTIQVSVGSKKLNQKYAQKYQSYFS